MTYVFWWICSYLWFIQKQVLLLVLSLDERTLLEFWLCLCVCNREERDNSLSKTLQQTLTRMCYQSNNLTLFYRRAIMLSDHQQTPPTHLLLGLLLWENCGKCSHFKLKNSIYGVKQSPQVWSKRFTEVVTAFRLHKCGIDHFVFLHRH